jgi:acyl-coenzyme A thioesterase PaaI-like protein
MSEAARKGPFWDMIEGRAPMPPVARLLGWTLLSIDPERGEIRVRFEAKPDFLNPAGTVQGGILSAMLDDRMGPAAVALLGGNFSNASGVWLTVLTTLVQSRHAFRSMRR